MLSDIYIHTQEQSAEQYKSYITYQLYNKVDHALIHNSISNPFTIGFLPPIGHLSRI